MKIAFTICSNNYLGQAKVLGDSLIEHNPDYKFIIGLADRKSVKIDYSYFNQHKIIEVEEIGIQDFESIWQKYNIIELNTSVKPSFIKYLLKQYPTCSHLFYLDPDIMVFNKFQLLEKEFDEGNILLTPHIVTPIEIDDLWPGENTFLNFGLYNLGFIGIKNIADNSRFLDWWEDRCLNLGYIKPCEGIFVDQLWINHVPLFFNKVKILFSLGYNVAPWNLHERKQITMEGSGFVMDDNSKLVFYHFSSYDYKTPEKISKYYTRYTFDNCENLKPIYLTYHNRLIENKVTFFSSIECFFVKKNSDQYDKAIKSTWRYWVRSKSKDFIPPIIWKASKRFINKVFNT